MNWLGELVQEEITTEDTVVSLGCGILQELWGLKCKSFLGMDIYEPYVNKLKLAGINVVLADATTYDFKDDRFDIVLALDVLEHLSHEDAIDLIKKMKSIANKKVIVYTPKNFFNNVDTNWKGKHQDINEWLDKAENSPYKGLGINKHQKHLCLITEEELRDLGFSTYVTRIDNNIFATWTR